MSERHEAGSAISVVLMVYISYKPQSDILHGVVGETFPQLVSIGAQALATYPAGATQESSRLLHLILKIYSSSITVSLSKHQQSAESLVPWGRLLFQMVNAQLPKDAVPEDEEEREKCEWWKAKKWAFKVLCTLFHRCVLYVQRIAGANTHDLHKIRESVPNAVYAQKGLPPVRRTFRFQLCARDIQGLSTTS